MFENVEGNLIKVRAQHCRNLFPRSPIVLGEGTNTFGITIWFVSSVLDGHPVSSMGIEVDPQWGGEITVTGEFGSKIDDTKDYIILAKETEHPKYGKQYQLLYINEDIDLKNVKGQRAFLKSFLSDLQIQELYKVFDNPLEVIDAHDTKELQKVKGIGPVLCEKICDRYEKAKDMSAIYIELDGMGLSSNLIQKLVARYQSPSKIIEMVKHNPYQLTYDVDGIGFLTADKIALSGGISPKSKKRIESYINYYLKEQGELGHSYVTASELLVNIYNELGGKKEVLENYYDEEGNVTGNNVQSSIQDLIDKKILGMEDNENKAMRRVYLMKYYNLEMEIAFHLKRLLESKNFFSYDDWEEKVSEQEKKQGFGFTDEQKAGIKLGLDNQVCYITGPAGSGKSSLVAGILSALNERYSFIQTALSGKAAANLQEITGETGMTIHRLLGYNPIDMGFMRNESNPLPYDIVILDELSLCGGSIFLDLIKAIPTGTKLICLGDQNQLEAIGALNLAADIYDSPIIPTVKLTKVHRQAQESGILTTSYLVKDQIQIHKENDYERVEVRGNLQDMILDCKIDKDQTKDDVMAYFNKYYYDSEYRNNIMQIQILSPVKERGDACVDELNKAVQAEINPVNENDYHKPKILVKRKKDGNGKDRSFWIQKGDKVMCIKNNYKFFDVYENPVSIFNGWVGIVKDIDDTNVIVDFPLNPNPTLIPRKEVGAHLILGYASTIHKCVTGDSWIHTNQGLMQIQDVTADMIGELTVWNGKYFEKPDAFYVNPPMPVWEIETKRKYKLSGLLSHRIKVLSSETGEIIDKEIKDIQEKEEVLINTTFKKQEKDYIAIPNNWLSLSFDIRTIIYNYPKYVNEDFAEFLGCMVADGVITSKGISYGKKEEDSVQHFKKLVKNIFGYEGSIKLLKEVNMYKIEISSAFIRDFCKNIPGIQPNNKFIPDVIIQSSLKIQGLFLKNLFEDGNINLKKKNFDHIEISLKEEKIIDQIRFLLLNWGIITTKYLAIQRLKGKKLYSYRLFIYKEDAKKFMLNIGFVSKLNNYKSKKIFNEVATNERITSVGIYKQIKKLFDNPNFILTEQLKVTKTHCKKRQQITKMMAYITINEYEKQLGENEITKYIRYILDNFYIDKIISIKKSEEKSTYCFNMPETHDLVVNGFYGKNCQGSGFKVVIGALDYSTPPGMLTHQLVYTLLTRAKKECVLVAQTGALKKAIATDFVSTKRTFLKEFLDGRLKIKLPPKTKKRVQQQENEQIQEQIDNEEMGINNENGET